MKKTLLIATYFAMTVCVLACASPSSLQSKLNNLHTMQAQFTQKLLDGNGKLLQQSKGEFWLKRPNHFRWVIQSPNPQQLVADGKNLWIYDVSLEQVTVKPLLKALKNTPAAILSDANYLLASRYQVRASSKGHYILTPHDKQAAFSQIQLVFAGKGLSQMALTDKIGQKTLIAFTQISQNETLPAARFHFSVPRGVDLIGKPLR